MAWRGKAAPAPKRGNGVLRGASVRVVRREKQPLHRQGGPPPLTQGRLLLAAVGGAGAAFRLCVCDVLNALSFPLCVQIGLVRAAETVPNARDQQVRLLCHPFVAV